MTGVELGNIVSVDFGENGLMEVEVTGLPKKGSPFFRGFILGSKGPAGPEKRSTHQYIGGPISPEKRNTDQGWVSFSEKDIVSSREEKESAGNPLFTAAILAFAC